MADATALAARLRDATKAAHRRLDHHPLLAALLRPTLTVQAYGQALAALHGAHGALEAALDGFAPAALFPRRLPDLQSDLSALGLDPCPLTLQPPQTAGDDDRLGMMYVIEGSNLGGVAIARQLASTLPAGTPRAFFGGAEGAPRWQRFWTFAQAHIEPDGFERATLAAREAFEFYRLHLDHCLGGR